MFCPNCGKDCGEYRFCPHCGAKMSQDTFRGKNTLDGSTDIPTSGGYLGIGGSVVLSDSAVSVCVKSLFKQHRTRIPYNQLVTVIYIRPTNKPHRHGALLLRGEENKSIPIPDNGNFRGDKIAVTVPLENDVVFYHLYYMLKTVAPPTARFEMISPSTGIRQLDKMAQMVDMDYFFNMYAPHRERAANGIQAKHEIPLEMARALVDSVFDQRQKKMYETDPLDAIRDLNLVVADMRRKQQRVNQADAERRKRQEQDSIKESLESLERMKRLEMLDDCFGDRND